VVPSRTRADAQQHGGGLEPAVAPNLQPVGAANGKRSDGPLGGPVVDVEPRVAEITNERRPLISGVLDGLAEQAFWCRVATVRLPDRVDERKRRTWHYTGRTRDTETGLPDKVTAVVFENGRVPEIRIYPGNAPK
jgi:hypothetical protein